MKRVVSFLFALMTIALFSGNTVMAASEIDIDKDHVQDGYVSIRFSKDTTDKVKLLVQSGDTKYYYNLSASDEYVNFPLQMGDGQYTVAIYQNTSGTKYRKLTSTSFTVDITDEQSIYLNSIQEVDFDDEDGAVQLANQLAQEALVEKRTETGDWSAQLTSEELIQLYYDYVVKNIKYDYQKISTLSYNYLPDNDVTLATGTGICYDYSSLLASMLRSQGVPTKLVKGYTSWTSVYHAWNEIYLESEDRWVIVDTTYDSYLYLRDRAYSFEKSAEVYSKTKEF